MALSLTRKRGRPRKHNADGSIDLQVVVSQSELRDLVKAISKHDDAKSLRKELRDGLRTATKPIVAKARSSVVSQPTKGKGSTGLRRDMARTVQLKVDLGVRSERIGVRVRLDPAKLRAHPRSLVAPYEGTRPWRHPIFQSNDRRGFWSGSAWVQQEHRGFLKEVVDSERPRVMREIEQTMNTIARKLEG